MPSRAHARPLKRLRDVSQSGTAWEEASAVKAGLRRVRDSRDPFYLEPADLAPVLKYKLRQQEQRTIKHRRGWSTEVVAAVTRAAFSVKLTDRETELIVRTGILTSLPGVGVPVASAILAMSEPEKYAIIDFRAWKQLFGGSRRSFSTTDYLVYMREVWSLADRLGWQPQLVDWCLWRLEPE
jgi:hypothetical protein